jgi:hypothetical protein
MIASIERTSAAAAGGAFDKSVWDMALCAWHGASAMSEAVVVHRRSDMVGTIRWRPSPLRLRLTSTVTVFSPFLGVVAGVQACSVGHTVNVEIERHGERASGPH